MKTKNILFGVVVLTLVLALQAQAQVFLTRGLVAFYPFSGDANDQSGYGNNPLANSASLTYDRFARTNAAYVFAGAQTIQYASPAQIQAVTNLTVSCWIQTTNYASSFHGLVCKATPTGSWVGFQVGVYHNHVQVQVDQTSFTSSASINDGKWHQICAVFNHDVGSVRIFVDGQLDSQFSTPVTAVAAPYQLYVGVDRTGFNYYLGSLDEIRIFNRVLTATEVSQLHAVEATEFSLPLLPLAISMSLSKQSSSNIIGTVATIAAPQSVSLKTTDLLNTLALDEQVQGSWPSGSFPVKSTLALAGHSLVVINGTNILLNVSDIMNYNTGQPSVISGKQNLSTGLADTSVKGQQVVSLMFDDTFISGGNDLKFYLNGLLSLTLTDTVPVNGSYTETRKIKISSGIGDGSMQDIIFINTGTVSASGNSTLHL
jgi:hypothetical protein